MRVDVNEQLGSSILAHTGHLDRFRFQVYGMFRRDAIHGIHELVCDCGDEVAHTTRVLGEVEYSILRSRGGIRVAYDVGFGALGEIPSCVTCDGN